MQYNLLNPPYSAHRASRHNNKILRHRRCTITPLHNRLRSRRPHNQLVHGKTPHTPDKMARRNNKLLHSNKYRISKLHLNNGSNRPNNSSNSLRVKRGSPRRTRQADTGPRVSRLRRRINYRSSKKLWMSH